MGGGLIVVGSNGPLEFKGKFWTVYMDDLADLGSRTLDVARSTVGVLELVKCSSERFQ